MKGLAERVAEVLAEHAKECDSDRCEVCDCGWITPELQRLDYADDFRDHAAHVAAALMPLMTEALADAWDAAIEHVWELSDPIDTVERYDGLAMVNTVADMRQAKQENPYRVEA